MKLSRDDKFYEIKLSTLNTEENESLEADDNLDKKKDKRKKEDPFIIYKDQKKHIETTKLKV